MSDDTKEAPALLIVLAVLSFPFTIWLRPHTVICLYEWHVRPIFGGPLVTWVQAFCLLMFVGAVRGYWRQEENKGGTYDKVVRFITVGTLVPLAVLGLGWVLR